MAEKCERSVKAAKVHTLFIMIWYIMSHTLADGCREEGLYEKFRLRDYLPVLIMVLCAVIFGVLLATGSWIWIRCRSWWQTGLCWRCWWCWDYMC